MRHLSSPGVQHEGAVRSTSVGGTNEYIYTAPLLEIAFLFCCCPGIALPLTAILYDLWDYRSRVPDYFSALPRSYILVP